MIKTLVELDDFALQAARGLAARQPQCSKTINQLQNQPYPDALDTIPIFHNATGDTDGITIQQLASFIGSGSLTISQSTKFSGLFFNYGYYVGQQLPNTGPIANTNAMNAMCADMAAGFTGLAGGWAWIPQFGYSLNFVNNGYAITDQTRMTALGEGGVGSVPGSPNDFHFTVPGDGLLFTCFGSHTSGGSYFEHLSLLANSPTKGNTAAIFANQWNIRAKNCNIINFPVAFFANGLSSGVEQCTILYKINIGSVDPPSGTGVTTVGAFSQQTVPLPNSVSPNTLQPTQIILSAPQVYAVGPGEMFQTSINNKGGSPGPANIIGIGVGGTGGGPVEHAVVRDFHISDYSFGISYVFNCGNIPGPAGNTGHENQAYAGSSGTKGCVYDSLEIQSYISSLVIMSPGAGANHFGDRFTNCMLQKSGDTTDPSAVVYIDATTNGGGVNNVNDLQFSECTIYNNSQMAVGANCYGVNIFSGSNIKFTGGTISNMGTVITDGSANVAITSANVARVLFTGVNLRQTYPNAKGTNLSAYAVLVTANPSDRVDFVNCNMSTSAAWGTGGPVKVTGSNVVNLFVTNCPGYNDQNFAILSGVTHLPVTGSSAVSANTAGTLTGGANYYGPSLVQFTATGAGVNFKCKGFTIAIPANGSYFAWLNSPNDSISFDVAANVAAFSWIGS